MHFMRVQLVRRCLRSQLAPFSARAALSWVGHYGAADTASLSQEAVSEDGGWRRSGGLS